MKVSGVDTPNRVSFPPKNAASKKPKPTSSYNFCGNDSTTVGAAIIGASALIGFLIYLGLSPQAKKAEIQDKVTLQTQTKEAKEPKATSFRKHHKKNVTVNRPNYLQIA